MTAYLIKNIVEYGKLIAYCIDHDISVWRSYWDEDEAGDRCYFIDWREARLYYSSKRFYTENRYNVIEPYFYVNGGRYFVSEKPVK